MKQIKFMVKVLVILIFAGSMLKAGFSAIAATTSSTQTTTQNTTYDLNNIVISGDVLAQIQASDSANYDNNVSNYKNLLINLNVSPKFKQDIENLILDGHALPDILISYSFLYHQFGTMSDVKSFLTKKESGAAWVTIFTDFDNNQTKFVPRSFDSDYLEKLMSTPAITSDDIMIADRVSAITKTAFVDLINGRQQGESWRDINANVDILYSKGQLPRIQITSEQIQQYTATTTFNDNEVMEAFVLANKVGKKPQDVIKLLQSGNSNETIFADTYKQIYN